MKNATSLTKGLALLIFAALFSLSQAQAVFRTSLISSVWGGYPDGSIAFIPLATVANPADCDLADAYVIPSDYDTETAMGVLLAGMVSRSRVSYSVVEDECHTPQQTDVFESRPVVQRVGLRLTD